MSLFHVMCVFSVLSVNLIIVYFLLGISPASNCSWPTFRNPLSVPSSKAGCTVYTVHPAFEDGTDTGFRNVGQLQFDAGEIPRRKYTIFKSRRKSEIKKSDNVLLSLPSAAISVSVYLFIHSVRHATLDASITVHDLYNTKHNLQYMDSHTI